MHDASTPLEQNSFMRHSLAARVTQLAATIPDRPAYTFVDYSADLNGRRETLTWSDVDRRARAVAAVLASRLRHGERAAVLAPQGLGYVVAMLGAFYARVTAVPLFTPGLPGHRERLERILADADPACVLTTAPEARSVADFLRDHRPPSLQTEPVLVDIIDPVLAAGWRDDGIEADDVAYLQYTSGSTRQPAGVMITHRCLAANAAQISAALGLEPGFPTAVGWLPLFHDMGFVMTVAMPIALGVKAVFTDPAAFLMRPVRWLQLVSGETNVVSAGPNFAYEYCAARIADEDKAALDLSGVYAFLNGAEPVRPSTMERFASAFARCGLAPEAMTPAYGLAEATVCVAVGPPGRAARIAAFDRAALECGLGHLVAEGAAGAGTPATSAAPVLLASCGEPAGQHVAIVGAGTRTPCAAGHVGEIWVHGPNVAPGYFRQPGRDREVFGATLGSAALPARGDAALPGGHPQTPDGPEPPGGLPADGWLRTGDLGLIHDGELFVTGRLKDLIIVDGRNHYPQDVEVTAQNAHPVIRRDRVAAFAVPGSDFDRVVVVAERARQVGPGEVNRAEVARAVRGAVSAHHDLRLHDFLLVEPGAVPRTSSGKIARSASRERYLAGAFGPRAE
ncbi:MAG: fatty acyl-AMP ligase [Micromonosporaceae bacterium]